MPSESLSKLVDKLQAWLEQLILLTPNLVIAVMVLIAFWLGARVVRKVVRRLVGRALPRQASDLLGTIAYIVVLLLGVFVALGIIGLQKTLTSVLAGAGIIGLALAFAFQDIAANFFAGMFLSFRRPFGLGDIVETNGFEGTIDRIDLRSTRMKTRQGQIVLIPNRLVFENPLINYTGTGRRRIDLEVGVSYGDDLEKAKRVAMDSVKDLEGVIDEVRLFYTEFGGSSINFVLQMWIEYKVHSSFMKTRSEAIQAVKKAFDENDITIPFPIRTLDFGIVGGETLAEQISDRSTPSD